MTQSHAFTKIKFTQEKAVAKITLNDPKASNALSEKMKEELYQAIQLCENDAAVRIILISGEGKNFCAGANLSEVSSDAVNYQVSDNLWRTYFPILNTIAQSDKIYISCVQGAVAGIAGALVMTSDFTLMTDTSYMYQPFLAINLVPDGGIHWHLAQTVGYKRALSLILTGTKLPASECTALGLATECVPVAELESRAQELAAQLLKGPRHAQSATKRILRKAMTTSLNETFENEAKEQNALFGSPDFLEGVAAFFEKRAPNFKE